MYKQVMGGEFEKDIIIKEQKSTINLMLAYIILAISLHVFYLLLGFVNNYMSKNSSKPFDYFSYLKYVYTFFNVLELAAVIIIAALLKNNNARAWFITFAAIKLLTTIYWTYSYFK